MTLLSAGVSAGFSVAGLLGPSSSESRNNCKFTVDSGKKDRPTRWQSERAVERTSSRAGVSPAEVQRLFTAHYFNNNPFETLPTPPAIPQP